MTASPAGLAYNDLTGIENYAHDGAALVISAYLLDDPKVKAVAAAGCMVFGYIGLMESPTWGSAESDLLYQGRPAPDRYLWTPKRQNFPGAWMTDVRPGSAWTAQALSYCAGFAARHPHVRGGFLDVYGERLWSAAWDEMSPTERATWSAAMRTNLRPYRDALNLPVMVNGTWAAGNPDADGACIEGHPISENAGGNWTRYLANPWGGDLHLAIVHSEAEALAWAQVPGVRWVALDQSNYARVGPVWGDFVPTGAPPPAPPPALQKPVPPAFSAAALDDGTVRVVIEPLPDSAQVSEYQLYGVPGQNDPGKNHKVIPPGATIISGLAPDVPITLRASARNAAGYGPWAPAAGLVVTPHVSAAPPPSSDPCADLRAARDQAITERDAARAIGLGLMDRIDAAKAALG